MQLSPVAKEDAGSAIEIVDAFQKRFRKKHGESIAYCADEMYIKAELPFPSLQEYGELPQIENGVGMVPLFINQSRKLKFPKTINPKKRFLTITGTSFYPYLKKFIGRLTEREHLSVDVVQVENRFFGQTVTVAGLLTGRDVISTIHGNTETYDFLIIPEVLLREGDTLFLDNVSLGDLEEATGLKVLTTDGTPQGFIDTLAEAECRT
jgi:NifB/MoaA-like Fe-S oxidoreductase